MITKIIPGYSNWEIVVFIIINKLVIGKNRYFSRSEVMTNDNLKLAEVTTVTLGHKEKPQRIEETIQRTLQNMRDKGYINFLGEGDYKLTDKGIKASKIICEKYSYDGIMSAITA